MGQSTEYQSINLVLDQVEVLAGCQVCLLSMDIWTQQSSSMQYRPIYISMGMTLRHDMNYI
jgi:hypothetical protein